MNWIIHKSKLMPYHTNLSATLTFLKEEVKNLQWLIADLDYMSAKEDFPLNMIDDYFILSPEDFEKVINQDVQIIWGAFLGIPKYADIIINEDQIPYVETNQLIWKNGNIQHPEALMEIDCIDSGYTIVKFRTKLLSDKFKAFFGKEAIELERFKNK